ncbi:hypothetical protein TNCV_1079721 [Trichonephila clavipes]|nr:hypothetical protein TNCV_1079721 [Trichonephila clavipes]
MKKFNQTPYKLSPPTPFLFPAEKRPLEEKSLPKKRVRITPVMRRVSRRSEILMAPMQIPQPPVQIPDVPQSPVQIPLVPQSPVQIPDVPQSPVQIPDVLENVKIPDIPQSPVQIPLVPQSPVQIPLVPQSPVQIPVSQVLQPPVQILFVQIPNVPQHIPVVPEPVQIPVSQVPQSPVQSLPEPMQILPELDILDPLESTDAFDQLMSFVFGPQELQLLHTVPSIFYGDLFSFLDEFEKEPMDLTMPRLNSCVKNIGFKPIQPMDLSVNSSIGQ